MYRVASTEKTHITNVEEGGQDDQVLKFRLASITSALFVKNALKLRISVEE